MRQVEKMFQRRSEQRSMDEHHCCHRGGDLFGTPPLRATLSAIWTFAPFQLYFGCLCTAPSSSRRYLVRVNSELELKLTACPAEARGSGSAESKPYLAPQSSHPEGWPAECHGGAQGRYVLKRASRRIWDVLIVLIQGYRG